MTCFTVSISCVIQRFLKLEQKKPFHEAWSKKDWKNCSNSTDSKYYYISYVSWFTLRTLSMLFLTILDVSMQNAAEWSLNWTL